IPPLRPHVPYRPSGGPFAAFFVPDPLAGVWLQFWLPVWTVVSPRPDGGRFCSIYQFTDGGLMDTFPPRRRSARLASVRAVGVIADRRPIAHAPVGGESHRFVDDGGTAHSLC